MQDAGDPSRQRSTGAELVACQHCGAANSLERTDCWLCHGAMPGDQPQVSPPRRSPQSFALSSLFLMVTLIAVCMGVAVAAPGMAVVLLIVVVPALVRTFAATNRDEHVGDNPTVADKLANFVISIGLVLLVCVAAFIAFNVACWSLCGLAAVTRSEALIVISIGGGVLAAIACAGWLLWKTWPT